jgi:hypothetical protein
MFSFKSSLIALIRLPVIVVAVATLMPLVSRGQGDIKNPLKRDPRKPFYLTQATHNASQALSACAEGYHMASLWEIHDPSNLRYDTELGFTTDDSGFGPPSDVLGMIRSGLNSSVSNNCQVWTSDSSAHNGILVRLVDWTSTATVSVITPWEGAKFNCVNPNRVWCVQD